MKLANLLSHHHKYAKQTGALENVFGDGYLCAHNRIYREARERAIAVGFKFSADRNDAYRALPLAQLDNLLKAKTIPYIDNVTVLESLEARIPNQTVWDDIIDGFKGNHVFHESCHAYARSKIRGLDPALGYLLEESYANAQELLSILDAEDKSHRLFLELNSYVYMLEDRVHLIAAEKAMGLSALTRFMILSYLHANYLRETFEFERMLKLSTDRPVDDKTAKSLKRLAKIAWQLNPRFREVTTRFYFKLQKVEFDPTYDFMTDLERSPILRELL